MLTLYVMSNQDEGCPNLEEFIYPRLFDDVSRQYCEGDIFLLQYRDKIYQQEWKLTLRSTTHRPNDL